MGICIPTCRIITNFFRCLVSLFLVHGVFPFFLGLLRSRVRPRSGCCRVGGSGVVRPPACQPRTSHAPRPTQAGGGSPFLRSVPPFRSVRPFLLPPLKAASLAFVRLARVCLSRVCLACGGSRAVVLRAAHFHCIHL